MAEDSTLAEKLVVRDFAIPLERYPHVLESGTLHEAVAAIQSHTFGQKERLRYSEALVLNGNNQLVGRVTIRNILEGLDPHLVPKIKGFQGRGAEFPNLTFLWGDAFFRDCGKQAGRSIKELVTPIPQSVKGEDSLLKALSIMLAANESALPVIEQDRIQGVIRLEEIFTELTSRCNL
jgi:CBS domain-containing protein